MSLCIQVNQHTDSDPFSRRSLKEKRCLNTVLCSQIGTLYGFQSLHPIVVRCEAIDYYYSQQSWLCASWVVHHNGPSAAVSLLMHATEQLFFYIIQNVPAIRPVEFITQTRFVFLSTYVFGRILALGSQSRLVVEDCRVRIHVSFFVMELLRESTRTHWQALCAYCDCTWHTDGWRPEARTSVHRPHDWNHSVNEPWLTDDTNTFFSLQLAGLLP